MPRVAAPPLCSAMSQKPRQPSQADVVLMFNRCWGHSPGSFRDLKILFSTSP